MGKTVHTEAVQDLFEAILTLETEEECFNFFEDVCTVNELLSIAQRFAVAKMLKEDNTYLEVIVHAYSCYQSENIYSICLLKHVIDPSVLNHSV